MTCIVGIATRDGCVLAGDALSGRQSTWQADRVCQPKVVELTPHIAVGFTTSFRMGQILAYSLGDLPQPPEQGDLDPVRFAVVELVPLFQKAMRAAAWTKIEHSREEAGSFLLAVRDRLLEVCSDWCVLEYACHYAAVGAAAEIAIGALHATRTLVDLETRARSALDAANAHSAAVMPPYAFAWTAA